MADLTTTSSVRASDRERLDAVQRSCWCGQDLAHAGTHCPRCGTTVRGPWTAAARPVMRAAAQAT